jgi:hypothetical protein
MTTKTRNHSTGANGGAAIDNMRGWYDQLNRDIGRSWTAKVDDADNVSRSINHSKDSGEREWHFSTTLAGPAPCLPGAHAPATR